MRVTAHTRDQLVPPLWAHRGGLIWKTVEAQEAAPESTDMRGQCVIFRDYGHGWD